MTVSCFGKRLKVTFSTRKVKPRRTLDFLIKKVLIEKKKKLLESLIFIFNPQHHPWDWSDGLTYLIL